MSFLDVDNRRVLAFVREYEGERVLVVANLSRFTQGVHLNLSAYAGSVPVEMFGRSQFPAVNESPYFMSLGPHTFFWFALEPASGEGVSPAMHPLALGAAEDWTVFLDGRRAVLERALMAYLPARRWFGSKTRAIKRLAIEDVLSLGRRTRVPSSFLVLRVEYDQGEPESFGLLLAAVPAERAAVIEASVPWAPVVSITQDGEPTLQLVDGLAIPEVASAFLGLFKNRVTLAGRSGSLEFTGKPSLRAAPTDLPANVQRNEQSNTSISFGDRFMLKVVRRIEPGPHPQVELDQFLGGSAVAESVPELLGTATYRNRGGRNATVAMIENHIQHQSDGWLLAVDELGRFLEEVASAVAEPPVFADDVHPLDVRSPDAVIMERTGAWLELVGVLGRRTAQLHIALSDGARNAEFTAEPYTPFYQRALSQGFRVQARQALRSLKSNSHRLSGASGELAARVLSAEPELLQVLQRLSDFSLAGQRIRCHGDLHLGQVLATGADWVFIDFEGEPARSLGERRIKRSPLRDVAGMVRSFYYAAQFSMRQLDMAVVNAGTDDVRLWARAWYLWTSAAYLRAYFEEIAPAQIIAGDQDENRCLLDTFMIDKALYELGYELDNRPTWVDIPLESILDLLKAARRPASRHETGG